MEKLDWRSKLKTWVTAGNSPTIPADLRDLRDEFVADSRPKNCAI